jgi:hypothetical protein
MKNITLSADDALIAAAREQAAAENTTLNEQFRLWLAEYARKRSRAESAMSVVLDIRQYADVDGHKFTRDEMNER